MEKTWQLQDAKNKLSEVLDLAIKNGPQTITRHGKPEGVVLSFDDFKKMVSPKNSLVDFFSESPLQGVEIDLERDKDLGRRIKL